MGSPSQHQRSHTKSIYLATGTKYASKVILICEPKTRKSSHARIYSYYCLWSSVYNSLWERVIPSDDCEEVPVKKTFIPP